MILNLTAEEFVARSIDSTRRASSNLNDGVGMQGNHVTLIEVDETQGACGF